MSTLNTTNPLSDDSRMLAASTAARTERRNKPMHLVYGACAVLALVVVWCLMSYSTLRRAQASLVSQQRDADAIRTNAVLARSLRVASASDTNRKLSEQEGQIRTRLQTAAVNVGIKQADVGNISVNRSTPQNIGSTLIKVGIEATNETLPPLLAWLERCVVEFPGLEVYKVTIKPEAQKWRLKAQLTRWEKVEPK